jgi:hypothetical protein
MRVNSTWESRSADPAALARGGGSAVADLDARAHEAARDIRRADQPPRRKDRPHRPIARLANIAFVAAMLLVCLLPAVWPGDAPWTNDEPHLLAAALDANAAHRPAAMGLYGSYGVPYGPLPTQIYQVLLLVTHNPVLLVAIRGVLTMSLTAGGLLWLARTLRLPRWFIPAVLVSPFLWLYSRMLWDNTFAIPAGTLALAAYASFLATGRRRSLLLTVGCLIALLSIHFMTAPLVAGIGGHLLWRHRPALWRHRLGLAMVLALGVAMNAGYFIEGSSRAWEWWSGRGSDNAPRVLWAADRLPVIVRSAGFSPYLSARTKIPPNSDRPSRLTSLLFPLLGGRILSGDGFYVAWGSFSGPLSRLISACKGISWLGFGLVWAGLIIAIRRGWIGRRHRGVADLRGTMCGIAVVVLGLQMVMYGAMRVAPFAHYFTGACGVYILLAWFAAEAAGGRGRAGVALLIVYGLALGVLTACGMVDVHRAGGSRNHFGPSLAGQIEIARGIGNVSGAADVVSDIPQYREHVHGLFTLRRLLGIASPGERGANRTQVEIRYRSETGWDAHLNWRVRDPQDSETR